MVKFHVQSAKKKQRASACISKQTLVLFLGCVALILPTFANFHALFQVVQVIEFEGVGLTPGEAPPSWKLRIIPEDKQSTAYDYNYSRINRGKFANGKWKSQRKQSHIPPLFMDRLNRLLPECPPMNDSSSKSNHTPCDNHTRLFPEDVQRIEEELLQFDIPRKIVILWHEAVEYVSLQYWRWNLNVDTLNQTLGTRKMCPNCHIRYANGPFPKPDLKQEPAHVDLFPDGCSGFHNKKIQRDTSHQVVVGGCGESQAGTGRRFWQDGIHKVDYDMSFVDQGGPFVTTYAHLHLSPDKDYHPILKPLHNVTEFVQQLLQPVPSFPRHIHNQAIRQRIMDLNLSTEPLEQASSKYDASFIHGNCWKDRGSLLRSMMASRKETNVSIAAYGACFHNANTTDLMGGGWGSCQDKRILFFLHEDCEGHRDASKTVLASHHKFGFALENTWSPYYFTEKRWQVLLAASVPIVWDNHNSLQYLPDPDAALVVPANRSLLSKSAKEIAQQIHYYAQPEHEQEYLDRFFAWKKRGLRPDFVRKLFLSSDFVVCRMCKYMAHHHFYEEEE